MPHTVRIFSTAPSIVAVIALATVGTARSMLKAGTEILKFSMRTAK